MASQFCRILAGLAFFGVHIVAQAQTCPTEHIIGLKRPLCTASDGSAGGEVNIVCKDYRYCETMEVLSRSSAIIWNTIGCNSCPDEEWDAFWKQHRAWSSTTWILLVSGLLGVAGLVAWKVKGNENGANEFGVFGWILVALLLLVAIVPAVSESFSQRFLLENGPRSWTIDSIVQSAPESGSRLSGGEVKAASFNGIGHKYVALMKDISEPAAFEDVKVSRSTIFKIGKGRQVYMLKKPSAEGGETYIMQSYHLRSNKLEDLLGLKPKLSLPTGWEYQCKVVGDNGLNLEAPKGLATVTQDNLHNTYMQLFDPGNCFPFSQEACTQETEQTMDKYRSALCGNQTGLAAIVEDMAHETIV